MVNYYGRDGTAPDPLVWSAGALPKRRRLVSGGSGSGFFARATWYLGVRSGFVFLHLLSVLMMLLFGPTLLVSWLSGFPFLGTLHWPAGGLDLAVGGLSYVELLILYVL